MKIPKAFLLQKLFVLFLLTVFSGCSMLLSAPEPMITNITDTDFDFSTETGGTAKITVTGSTIGDSEGLITNYTGTLKLYYASSYGTDYAVRIGDEITVDGVFSEEITLTFTSVGEYKLTAELSDTYDNVVTKTFTVRFYPSILDDVDTITEIDDSSAPYRIEKTRTSTSDVWYSMTMNDEDADVRQCFHWGDYYDKSTSDSYTADIYVSIYDHSGALIEGPRDNGWWASGSYASDIDSINDGIELFCDTHYSLGETLFVKVTGSSGTFGFYTYCPGY
ncbi:MAG: hypothetical protein PQJ61_17230 [Spirochaetales bacterium]|uniref:Uncharacterized protein n=1 Tax=Candidatus Thalassospirochaeta sargassi TaxID=3119039 RepID=A0AAJ1IFQ8_9SPIO|nr:hypothetical protein [Spirochaetales bacterium]